MTTNEKREPPLSVGFDIVNELSRRHDKAKWPPLMIEDRAWLANRITEAVNAARRQAVEDDRNCIGIDDPTPSP